MEYNLNILIIQELSSSESERLYLSKCSFPLLAQPQLGACKAEVIIHLEQNIKRMLHRKNLINIVHADGQSIRVFGFG